LKERSSCIRKRGVPAFEREEVLQSKKEVSTFERKEYLQSEEEISKSERNYFLHFRKRSVHNSKIVSYVWKKSFS
jgi:hypothetical protein